MPNFLDKFLLVTSESAPADEKYDANSELFREFIDDIKGDVVRQGSAEELGEWLQLGKGVELYKPGHVEPYTSDTVLAVDRDLSKALPVRATPPGVLPVMNRRGTHRSYLYIDELGIVSGGHMNYWVEKLSPFGFTALKMMVEHMPILNAAIITRIRQLNAMSAPYDSQDEHPLGFVCIPKGKKVGDKLSDEEKKVSEDIGQFIMSCGDEIDPRKRRWLKQRDNMTTFIAKFVRDTLTLDACPIETEMTQSGKISGFYNIPAETVRLAHEEGYLGDDRIIALQVMNDMVISYYTPQDIIYEIRNPRSDIQASKYGYGETEMVVRLVTGFLNAMTFNQAFFDRNNIPRGFLTMYGNFDSAQLNDFKRMWNASLSGPAQKWRMPIFVSQNKESGHTYTRVDEQPNEMMFAKWMTFLISIICAVYGLSPEEINSDSFTSRNASPLSGHDTSEKLAHAKDKGLEPLASWIEGIYNEYIIPVYNPDYIMRYVGLHPQEQKEIFEMKKLAWTVNEMRHALGNDEMEDPDLGEAPLNPALIALYQGKMQQQQMEAQGQGPQAQQYGLPQDVLNNLGDEDQQQQQQQGGQDQMAGRQSNGAADEAGAQNIRQAEQATAKAQRRFIVEVNRRDPYADWRWQ